MLGAILGDIVGSPYEFDHSFEDALRNAVSLGGDSDTLACITGGIAEAFYGMPQELRDETLKHPRKVRGWRPARRAACSSADEGFA